MQETRMSYRLDEPEVTISLTWNTKSKLDKFDINFDGTELAAVPTFLESARRSIEDSLYRSRDQKQEEENHTVVDLPLWGIQDCREAGGPRIMACGRIRDDVALFAKEWKYWKAGGSGESAIPRPQYIKKQHNENCMKNFKRAKDNEGLDKFINAWEEKCVIICGSGPSLIENKRWIPEDDPRFEVIAINEACSILEPEQIDYCFLADRAVEKHPEWFPEEVTESTTLITHNITPPDIVDWWDNVYFWRSNNLDNADDERVMKNLQHLHPLDVGQTATYSCFHFAYLTGSPYIIFGGQDFSCTSEMYSAGTTLTAGTAEAQDMFLTDGLTEDEVVLTCDRLVRNMRIIKGAAAFVGDDQRVVVNGSGRGIFNLETPPNSNPTHFTPANNRNLNMKHAVAEARQCVSSSNNTLENSYEVQECQVNTG